MFEKLSEIEDRHRDLEAQLADPEVISDGARYTQIAKQHAELSELVAAYRQWCGLEDDLQAASEMLDDTEGEERELLEAEVEDLSSRKEQVEERLRSLLVPTDPFDDKDVIVEIRSAAGGDEAGLFAGELRDMYTNYAESMGWRARVLSQSEQGIGGIKEAVLEVVGDGAYGHLKHESGVHRVQRVPATESQGRIHTSTASVAVLPAAEDVDVEVNPSDLRIDVYRSSGPGGQSVNTTDSAVRITHEPTGVVVACQDEKSQHQNRDKAMRILRSRLLQAEQERQAQQRSDARKGQIGTGDRSEKIRTYNFPQTRITDHRINLTVHDLEDVLGGRLHRIVEALRTAEREALLADASEDDPKVGA